MICNADALIFPILNAPHPSHMKICTAQPYENGIREILRSTFFSPGRALIATGKLSEFLRGNFESRTPIGIQIDDLTRQV